MGKIYLYHVTDPIRLGNIMTFGLTKHQSEKETPYKRLDGRFVYGFATLEGVSRYIRLNEAEDNYMILQIDASDYKLIPDTEFKDGGSFAISEDVAPTNIKIHKIIDFRG